MRFSVIRLSLLSCLALSGCVMEEFDDIDDSGEEEWAEGEEEIGETEQAVLSTNGMSVNGMSVNGMSVNGMSVNGMSVNGMSVNGMSVNGSQLVGVKSNGVPVSGTGFVGALMTGNLSNGGTITMRIDAAQTLPAPNSDVWAYRVSYALAGGVWAPLCGSSTTLAIPLAGTWNLAQGVPGGGSWSASSTSFTFGCRGAALAKCVELGYKPWKTLNGVLLRNHHQSCVRMIRADYCGDGKSWTTDGNVINVYDNLGIQTDASSTMKIDAEWIPSGARCIHIMRDFQDKRPSCEVTKKSQGDCGKFTSGALLVNEYKPFGAP
jgi:ADYC domain